MAQRIIRAKVHGGNSARCSDFVYWMVQVQGYGYCGEAPACLQLLQW